MTINAENRGIDNDRPGLNRGDRRILYTLA